MWSNVRVADIIANNFIDCKHWVVSSVIASYADMHKKHNNHITFSLQKSVCN